MWAFPGKEAFDACNFTGATQLHKPVHHSYELPTGDKVDGRALFYIDGSAKNTWLYFGCSVKGHCHLGQKLQVRVGGAVVTRNTKEVDGVCPNSCVEPSLLCPP